MRRCGYVAASTPFAESSLMRSRFWRTVLAYELNSSAPLRHFTRATSEVFVLNGYFTSSVVSTVEAYTVSPAYSTTPTATTASTSSSPSAGVESYTVSGLPTASGTEANIALFPCSGTAQTSNNTSNGAPTVSGTGVVFTAPGGTSPTAGDAIGQGDTQDTSSAGGIGNTGTGSYATGTVAGFSSTAYIASVNGVPSTDNGAGAGPTMVQAAPTNGTLSFVLNSFQGDCAVPVVYTTPTTSNTTPPLLVNANGTVQTGYAVGIGNATQWQAPAAPASSTGYTVNVDSVSPSTNTFTGTLVGAAPQPTYSFTYGVSGSTYSYTDGTPITESAFASYLSGAEPTQVEPNTTTPVPVAGDTITTGAYASGTATSFKYNSAYNGDVPSAPTSVTSTFNGAAYTSGVTSEPGVVVTWTPPVNPDVSGGAAVAAGTSGNGYTGNAVYTIYQSTVSSAGVASTPTIAGAVTVVGSGVTPNNGVVTATSPVPTTSESSPEFIVESPPSGETVEYYVTATAATGTNGGGMTGPFSAASNTTSTGTISAPAMKAVTIVPGVASPSSVSAPGTPPAYPAGTGEAAVTYSEAVTCLSAAGSDFSYSNSNGTPHPIAGVSCAQAPAGEYNGATTDNSADTLIISFAPYSTTTISGTTTYTANTVAAPANGDSFTYTAPTSPTTANAVYAGPVTSPSYAATQTLTANGNNTPGQPLVSANAATFPFIETASSAAAGSSSITVTYNEAVSCSAAGTDGDWAGAALGGATVTGCAAGATSNQLVLALSAADSTTGALTYTQATPTAANAVYAGTATAPYFALSPQTVTATD